MVAAVIFLYSACFLIACSMGAAAFRRKEPLWRNFGSMEFCAAFCLLMCLLVMVLLSFFRGYESLPLADGSRLLYENLPSRQWQVRLARLFHLLYVCSLIAANAFCLSSVLAMTGADDKFRSFARLFYALSTLDILVFLSSFFFPSVRCFDSVPVLAASDANFSLIAFKTNHHPFYYAHLVFELTEALYIFLLLAVFAAREHAVYASRYVLAGLLFAVAVSTVFFHVAGGSPRLDVFPVVMVLCLAAARVFVIGSRLNVMYIPLRSGNFSELSRPVVVFDKDRKLVDCNAAARMLFPGLGPHEFGSMSIGAFSLKYTGEQFAFAPAYVFKEIELMVPSSSVNFIPGLRYSPSRYSYQDDLERRVFTMNFVRQRDKYGRTACYTLIFADITESKREFATVKTLADIDQNSGLSSYHSLQNMLNDIDLHDRFPYTAVVCAVAGLKFIEHGMGRPEADNAVRAVASLVRSELRSTDFAAFYNDQIIILVPDGQEVAETVMARISGRLEGVRSNGFRLRLRTGICTKKDESYSMDRVLFYATERMNAKEDESINDSLIETMLETLGRSEFETERHLSAIREMCLRFGGYLSLSAYDMECLALLSDYHDIGKLSTPKDVLLKRGSLTKEEMELISIYSIKGYRLAKAAPRLAGIAELILTHNEHWDGSGRPNGLRGGEIPYLARVFAVVEAYDVMTNKTPYRDALSPEQALAEIERGAGAHFDADVVARFLSMMRG